MDTLYRSVVGIDVSKEKLDLYSPVGRSFLQVTSDAQGLAKLITWCKKLEVSFVCMEATGGYEATLVEMLHQHKIPLAVVNPQQIRSFARAKNQLQKTDCLDARLIADYAQTMQPQPQLQRCEESRELQELRTRRQQVDQMLIQEKNRLQQTRNPKMRKLIESAIDLYTKQKKELDDQLAQIVARNEQLQIKAQILDDVKGISTVTAHALLAEFPELGKLNRQQAARLAGLAPINRDSGQFRGKRMIGGGRMAIRRALYMPTLVATKHHPAIKAFYERLLQKGKSKMLALTACMRKLLVILNAKLKNYYQTYSQST
jgi:transposase